jgi:asparagine synthase (glutamine-hydrolysing)
MRDSMAHRGPDASGLWSSPDGSVVLGHRRLAILDLSEAGSQPMRDRRSGAVIAFNGEIYNHQEIRRDLVARGDQFSSRSDTEVLLAAYGAWGEQCVERLRGMFAFAIFDPQRRTLFLARDRAGEKPLYWAAHRQGLVFASELKAFMADGEFPRRLSPEALAHYLSFGYVPGDKCILKGVHKLEPAHCLSWALSEGAPTVRRYWDLPVSQVDEAADANELTEELHQLLESAVSEQMVADVPLAVLLSGGVDSSLVTAVAARGAGRQVRTFTVTLPGHPRLDESHYARQVAEYLGTDHVELPLESSSVDLIETLAAQYDEPIADSSMIPTYLLSKTVRRHCTVVLGGDGGDELFGGYLSYQGALRRDRLQHAVPRAVRALTAAMARHVLPCGTRGRNALMALAGNAADGIAQGAVWTDAADFEQMSPWLSVGQTKALPMRWRRDRVEIERGLPGAAMATDFRTYLPDDILVKVDRASMLCSLEVRAPFLDRRIVEFAFERVPNRLRVTLSDRKILLKRLARRLLPPQLDIDRKQGFTIPVSKWLTADVLSRWSNDCSDEIRAVVAERVVPRLIRCGRTVGAEHALYGLIMLTTWMRHYRISV